ncbi:uncharacterized protein LOC133206049 [Saccostrea echinata]|uniref:uncharacterized protein LOC133206049 n=1 Tax=Saccostrea echinata TaxID=191078 RepID=UPI002A83DEC5|nr:uncharacterized protein LOC133206049 [Saccostrea echinata]
MEGVKESDVRTDEESLEDMMMKFAEKLDNDLEKINKQSINTNSSQTSVTMEIHTAAGNVVTESGSDSLLSLMTDFAEKLDKDTVKLSSPTVQQASNIETNSSLASFLDKVADKMDTEILTKETSSRESQDLLQDMMKDLHKGIKSGDWLNENTAEKWVSENPDLAKEYMEAASEGHNS